MAQKWRPDLSTFSAIFLTEKAVPQTFSLLECMKKCMAILVNSQYVTLLHYADISRYVHMAGNDKLVMNKLKTGRLTLTGTELSMRTSLSRFVKSILSSLSRSKSILFASSTFLSRWPDHDCYQGVLEERQLVGHLTKIYSACQPPLCPQSSYYWQKYIVQKLSSDKNIFNANLENIWSNLLRPLQWN